MSFPKSKEFEDALGAVDRVAQNAQQHKFGI